MRSITAFILLCVYTSSGRVIEHETRGIIDWISGIISGSTTEWPITIEPQEPPENCPQCQCGMPRSKRRIVGGMETRVLEYPWMALLMYNGRFYCGGSLINDLYVLTAAHCTAGFRKERMSIRFMEHDRSIDNETKPIERKVARVIRHLRYNPSTYDNDIALLKLSERIDLSKAIKRDQSSEENDESYTLRPVCLAQREKSFSNYSGLAIGWGTTEEGGDVSNILREVFVPIISNKECRNTSYGNRITDNMICAGLPEGGKDACQGDSGGPLHVFNSTTETYQEVGITSWGEGCARPDKPGVYTRVNRYLTWISQNTKDACYCS